jgi:hypothetical protein
MDRSYHFILIAKRILRELRGLSEAVTNGFLGIQKQVEAVAKEQHAKNDGDITQPISGAILAVRDSVEHRKESSKAKKWGKRWDRFIAALTLAALIVYTFVNYHMLHEMRKATEKAGIGADAAKSLADTAASELELSQRPWLIKFDAVIIGPFIFDRDGGHITIRFLLKNVGRSPAVGVWIHDRFYPENITMPNPFDEQTAVCREAKKQASGQRLGLMLFPGEPKEIDISDHMSESEITDALDVYNGALRPFIDPEIVGCADYQSSFSPKRHQTGFIYHVKTYKAAHPGDAFAIDTRIATIPLSDLRLVPDFPLGFYAN